MRLPRVRKAYGYWYVNGRTLKNGSWAEWCMTYAVAVAYLLGSILAACTIAAVILATMVAFKHWPLPTLVTYLVAGLLCVVHCIAQQIKP